MHLTKLSPCVCECAPTELLMWKQRFVKLYLKKIQELSHGASDESSEMSCKSCEAGCESLVSFLVFTTSWLQEMELSEFKLLEPQIYQLRSKTHPFQLMFHLNHHQGAGISMGTADATRAWLCIGQDGSSLVAHRAQLFIVQDGSTIWSFTTDQKMFNKTSWIPNRPCRDPPK